MLIPAFNESTNIQKTLHAVTQYFDKNYPNYEVIVVDDGSADSTAKLAQEEKHQKLQVVKYKTNMGKGYALRSAFDHSSGEIISFFDAGLDFAPEQIIVFTKKLLGQNADMVIGSKRHSDSEVDYPAKRRVISLISQIVVKILFNLNVKDTQVGLKVFRREALADILPRALVKRYAYDIELLAMAQRYGYKIVEAPVKMSFNFRTSSVTGKAIWNSGWDTLAVFYRLRILKFYDKPQAEREKIVRNMEERYSRKI